VRTPPEKNSVNPGHSGKVELTDMIPKYAASLQLAELFSPELS